MVNIVASIDDCKPRLEKDIFTIEEDFIPMCREVLHEFHDSSQTKKPADASKRKKKQDDTLNANFYRMQVAKPKKNDYFAHLHNSLFSKQ